MQGFVVWSSYRWGLTDCSFHRRSSWSTFLLQIVRKPCKHSPAASSPTEWWSPNTTIQTCITDTSFESTDESDWTFPSSFLFVSLGWVSFFTSLNVVNVSLETRPGTKKRLVLLHTHHLLLNKTGLQCVFFFSTEYLTPSFSLTLTQWADLILNFKKYCSIHYICSRMNVTCILLKPKLILPDNARVAVYWVMHYMTKKTTVKCLDFPPEHKKHLDLDLREAVMMFIMRLWRKKYCFIYLFIYFSIVIFFFLYVTY